MPYYSRADVCRLLAEQYDTKSNVNLGRFQSQLEVSCMSSQTDELWMTIYIYMGTRPKKWVGGGVRHGLL